MYKAALIIFKSWDFLFCFTNGSITQNNKAINYAHNHFLLNKFD